MKFLIIVSSILGLIILLFVIEIILAVLGERETFKNPPREYIYMGKKGPKLTYLIMGDSTSAGQGGVYKNGIAYSAAEFLANKYKVEMYNTSISGATVKDVMTEQLQIGLKTKPDIVLISVGANDVTRLTGLRTIEENLSTVIDELIKNNCKVKIVLTGAPAMGSVRRFLQPLRSVAGIQTDRVNNAFENVIKKYELTFAPIANDTGKQFSEDATLFAEDKYHPNDRGYALWIPVINNSLEKALKSQPDHCE